MSKLRVGMLFGGQSTEHEVSVNSARNIINAIDKNKYEVIPIGITKSGQWILSDASRLIIDNSCHRVTLTLGKNEGQLIDMQTAKPIEKLDVVFPVLHGHMGEDGTVQGLLKLAHLPFVGAGVLSSAIGMDKDVMKRMLREANLPIGDFLTFRSYEKDKITYQEIVDNLGTPFFMKPANAGSSVGVSKIYDEAQFKQALRDVFEFDLKIVVERYIKGREIECSVLGNENPTASIPGEIEVMSDFYSYDAKYLEEHSASLQIPAQLNSSIIKKIQDLAIATFKTLDCEGMARVDFFVTDDNEIFINEINTIPGFTKTSMYPKLWEASGLSYKALIDMLITLAIERFKREQKLKITR